MSYASFAWTDSSLIQPFSNLLGYLSFSTLLRSIADVELQSIMFIAAMVWVVSIMLCAIWCGYSFNQTRFRVMCARAPLRGRPSRPSWG